MGKRGRRSRSDSAHLVCLAVRRMGDMEYLEECGLERFPGVRRLAEGEYRQALFPVASAVRALIHDALEDITRQVQDLPMYEREIKFLQKYIDGWTVTEISNEFGLSREHVSRTVRPKALNLLVRCFFHQLGI